MAPEYGATCGFFPVDAESIAYLRLTGRSEEQITLIETYLKEQGLFSLALKFCNYLEKLAIVKP
jgi:aconitate hydratase